MAPNKRWAPANETDSLRHIGKGKNGFTIVNDGPIEVAAGAMGEAIVRAVFLSERCSGPTQLCFVQRSLLRSSFKLASFVKAYHRIRLKLTGRRDLIHKGLCKSEFATRIK